LPPQAPAFFSSYQRLTKNCRSSDRFLCHQLFWPFISSVVDSIWFCPSLTEPKHKLRSMRLEVYADLIGRAVVQALFECNDCEVVQHSNQWFPPVDVRGLYYHINIFLVLNKLWKCKVKVSNSRPLALVTTYLTNSLTHHYESMFWVFFLVIHYSSQINTIVSLLNQNMSLNVTTTYSRF
jgi:hypothetical protein